MGVGASSACHLATAICELEFILTILPVLFEYLKWFGTRFDLESRRGRVVASKTNETQTNDSPLDNHDSRCGQRVRLEYHG